MFALSMCVVNGFSPLPSIPIPSRHLTLSAKKTSPTDKSMGSQRERMDAARLNANLAVGREPRIPVEGEMSGTNKMVSFYAVVGVAVGIFGVVTQGMN